MLTPGLLPLIDLPSGPVARLFGALSIYQILCGSVCHASVRGRQTNIQSPCSTLLPIPFILHPRLVFIASSFVHVLIPIRYLHLLLRRGQRLSKQPTNHQPFLHPSLVQKPRGHRLLSLVHQTLSLKFIPTSPQ